MLYNMSEFLTLMKENAQIGDIPLPVKDEELIKRFDLSALREFSVRYPYVRQAIVTSDDMIINNRTLNNSCVYVIPEKFYHGTSILWVIRLTQNGFGSEANMYMPNIVLGSADMVLESVADIKLAASLGSMMTHAPTHEFQKPNHLIIYNGWTNGSFTVELALKHDLSLSTIPEGAFTHLLQLATLDMEEYLYGKMKRKNNINTPAGDISLNLDEWSNAASEKRELLSRWDEDAYLDFASINYY